MPKVKWGSGSDALTVDDLNDDKENGSSFEPYDGPRPPKGVYGWRVKAMVQSESSGGFPQVIVRLELDPRGRAEHKRFAGYFVQDFIIVKKNTAFKVRPLLEALGVTYADFLNKTVVDDDKNITRIGTTDPRGKLLVGNIRPSKNDPQYEDISYLPAKDDDSTDPDDSDDADDGGSGEADPF